MPDMNPDLTQTFREPLLLKASDIYKSFGKKSVLNGINMELTQGKLYGVTGENGSGKTTLLNILAGYWKAEKGSVKVACKVGYCPQVPYLFSNLTVMENINLFSYAYGLNGKVNRRNSPDTRKKLFETFNFQGNENIICSELSEGTRQKLNLIISLLHDPDILLLDEPYSALDWDTYSRFWDFAVNYKSHGKTILIVSHLIYDRGRMDKIWQIKDGRLV